MKNYLFKTLTVLSVIVAAAFAASAMFTSCATDSNGNYIIDPAAKSLMLSVAQSEAHQIASSYLTTGNVDWKADLISGALSQIYTLQGTTTPLVNDAVNNAVGNVITDPALKVAVANAAISTINAAPQGTAKDTAISAALGILDTAIASAAASASSP
jgi:hypothetical protein